MFDDIIGYTVILIGLMKYIVLPLMTIASWLFCGFMLHTYIKYRDNIHDGFYKHFYFACLHLPLTTFLTIVLFFYY